MTLFYQYPESLPVWALKRLAYATIFSQFVQAAITLWYFKKKSPHVKIGRIRIDGELLPQVLSVGISALLMQILTLVQQTVIIVWHRTMAVKPPSSF